MISQLKFAAAQVKKIQKIETDPERIVVTVALPTLQDQANYEDLLLPNVRGIRGRDFYERFQQQGNTLDIVVFPNRRIEATANDHTYAPAISNGGLPALERLFNEVRDSLPHVVTTWASKTFSLKD